MVAMLDKELKPAGVRIPCATSNLGSGFDTIGLALDRYLEVWFEPGGDRLNLMRRGTLEGLFEDDEHDLIAISFLEVLEENGIIPRGNLTATSGIPVSRGLGSSAAALLAGRELGKLVLGEPRDDDGLFEHAYIQEGHGDDAAPCLHGGLKSVVLGPRGPLIIDLPLSSEVGFAYAAPATGVSTKEAREALPDRVEHGVAVRSLGRITALTTGLAEGDPVLLRVGVEDELHVPYRLPLILDAEDAIRIAYESGAWAVTISGAGSGLIAMCDTNDADNIACVMREVFIDGSPETECVGFTVIPDRKGLQRLPED